LFEAALEFLEPRVGAEHPQVVASRGSLAAAYLAVGRFAESERLARLAVEQRQRIDPGGRDELTDVLGTLGAALLRQSRWGDAEPILLESLAIREEIMPDLWPRYAAMSLLGEVRLAQKKHGEAEPLLVGGYEGLKAREARMPPGARPNVREAVERLVRLYASWGKTEATSEWMSKLGYPDVPKEVFARP
jgi:hypothetical protein